VRISRWIAAFADVVDLRLHFRVGKAADERLLAENPRGRPVEMQIVRQLADFRQGVVNRGTLQVLFELVHVGAEFLGRGDRLGLPTCPRALNSLR